MSCCLPYTSYAVPNLPEPHETAAVAIPQVLEELIGSPEEALDRLVRLRLHRTDPDECAPITDHLLVKIAVPALAAVAPGLPAHAALRSAGPAHSRGVRVDWPEPARHAGILREVLGRAWCPEADALVPQGPPPQDPWRWSLVVWLATMREDRAVAPVLRFWAERLGAQGNRRLAYALIDRALEILAADRNESAYVAAAERLCADLGLVWDAYEFGCRVARQLGRELPPRPALYTVPPERSPSVVRSILDEATRELASTAPADGTHRLERVAELWLAADEIDPERLVQELPVLITGLVRSERRPVAHQVLDLARACAASGPTRALIEALAGLVQSDAADARRDAADHILRAAERRIEEGRGDAALALVWQAAALEATNGSSDRAAAFHRRASAVAAAAGYFELAGRHARYATEV